MHVKRGYKQSEVGLIPNDWAVHSLRDVVEFANGRPLESRVIPDGPYWLITLDSIGIDGKLKTEHKRTTVVDDPLRKGDIVSVLSDIAHGNLLGLSDIIPTDNAYVLNQRMGRLRVKVPANSQFVRLQINRRQSHFRTRGQGTSQKHVYKRDFDSLAIPFPDIAEQEAIAEALSDANALIEALEQLLAKKRHIKQGAMRELLTGKKRLPGFCNREGSVQTELGDIPVDWEMKPLGELFDITSSKRVFQSEWKAEGVPFYRAREIAIMSEKGGVTNELFISKKMYDAFRMEFGVPSIGDMLVTGSRIPSFSLVAHSRDSPPLRRTIPSSSTGRDPWPRRTAPALG